MSIAAMVASDLHVVGQVGTIVGLGPVVNSPEITKTVTTGRSRH
jgi:uncharacterized membrane protein YdfJ with MMPL/SSD domain